VTYKAIGAIYHILTLDEWKDQEIQDHPFVADNAFLAEQNEHKVVNVILADFSLFPSETVSWTNRKNTSQSLWSLISK
jgi:hypothetical protein